MTLLPSNLQNPKTPASGFGFHPGWWMQVVRVRLRFLLIVIVAGLIVSQWPMLLNIWDRWTWSALGKPASGSVSSSHEYFCPMDPGVISAWPAICPICNMDLVPRRKMDAQMLPEGVIARMQLSPYRIQLAGIKTDTVAVRPINVALTITGVLKKHDEGSIGFDADLAESDSALLSKPLAAMIKSRTEGPSIEASAVRLDSTEPHRVRFTLKDIQHASVGNIVTAEVVLPIGEADGVLAIPESAVVDRGRDRFVYVESMPGQFDCVAVELGRRCGSFYPVEKGLKSGQRVASAGAFLIDAETRLNPSLATGYFGASQNEAAPTTTPSAAIPLTKTIRAKSTAPKARIVLTREEQALADKQNICPVTELSLNSMGGPVPVMVSGRKVFICCAGCEQQLKDDPDKYLARIPLK